MSTFTTGPSMRSWPAASTWFVILGVVWIALGLVAVAAPLYATLAFVWLFGILLLVGGVLHTAQAFMVRDRQGILLHLHEVNQGVGKIWGQHDLGTKQDLSFRDLEAP